MIPYMLLVSSKVDKPASVVINNKKQQIRLKIQQVSLPIFQRFKSLAAKLGLPSPHMGYWILVDCETTTVLYTTYRKRPVHNIGPIAADRSTNYSVS